jgi:hypothetical protein
MDSDLETPETTHWIFIEGVPVRMVGEGKIIGITTTAMSIYGLAETFLILLDQPCHGGRESCLCLKSLPRY